MRWLHVRFFIRIEGSSLNMSNPENQNLILYFVTGLVADSGTYGLMNHKLLFITSVPNELGIHTR